MNRRAAKPETWAISKMQAGLIDQFLAKQRVTKWRQMLDEQPPQ
jgi:hypothetical protein